MNSETVRPIPPRVFSSRRNEISVTPAIGESTSGGLISMSRILKGLSSLIRKPHEILTHVASVRPVAFRVGLLPDNSGRYPAAKHADNLISPIYNQLFS